MCDTLVAQVKFTRSILQAEVQMRGEFKSFKPVWKFHTSLKNLNWFKNIWATTYNYFQSAICNYFFVGKYIFKMGKWKSN